jgi:Protein of unknown function (DUF1292)
MGSNGFNTEQDEELTLDNRPVIFTTDEEGQNHQFQMVDMIEIEGQAYALLLYLGQDEDKAMTEEVDEEAEMVVMRVVQEGDDQVFEMLEDDEEYERVLSYLESLEDEEGGEEAGGGHVHGPGCSH